MRRRVYQDDLGPYIKHEGYIWRPLRPLHIGHGVTCGCGSKAVPGESLECATGTRQGTQPVLTVMYLGSIQSEVWRKS